MKKRTLYGAGIAVLGAYLLIKRRPKLYSTDELHNLFWDDEAGRWRSDAEVQAILREHPERVPEPLLTSEGRVLSHLAIIERAGKRFAIEPGLIAAIISKESGGDWAARGGVGEYGLMQIRESTAQLMGYSGDPDLLLTPTTNIHYGVSYLRRQFDRYSDEADVAAYAISAYNAGTAYKNRKFRNQEYVDGVINRWSRYTYLINRIHGVYGPPPPRPLNQADSLARTRGRAFGGCCPIIGYERDWFLRQGGVI